MAKCYLACSIVLSFLVALSTVNAASPRQLDKQLLSRQDNFTVDDVSLAHAVDEDEDAEQPEVTKRFSKLFEAPIVKLMHKQKTVERQRQVWRNLPNTRCYANPCASRLDCCRSASICHPQAHVCMQCQVRSACTSDADCCSNFPYCNNPTQGILSGECGSERSESEEETV